MPRARWQTKPDMVAECEDCDWECGQNGQGSAALHHDRTGHVVRVEVTRVIVYGADAPGKRRWWKQPG